MHATAWHNGGSPLDPAGYGIKFTEQTRDKHFDPAWETVILELHGDESTAIALSPSFWRSCSELRSADVAQWLLKAEAAPWPKGSPPGIAVDPVAGNRFAARVLKRRTL